MGGDAFHSQISEATFRQVCETNLFPLGSLQQLDPETAREGIHYYKAVFANATLSLLLSLDKTNKIETFLFKLYTNEKEKKKGAVATSNPLRTTLDKAVDQTVQPYMSLKNTVGLSIGMIKDGKVYYYSYGETARNNHQLPDEHTLFEIGSITKTFTATLLADAVNKGKVQLDDPVNLYLPDSVPALQFDNSPITLKTF